jgi:putative Ig domain-containing protein
MNLPPAFTSITTTTEGTETLPDTTATWNIYMVRSQNNDATVLATDPEGDALAYSAFFLQDGMAFNPSTRTLSWNPPADSVGKMYYVKFRVTSASGGTDSFIGVIRVTPVPPIGGLAATRPALEPGELRDGPNPTSGEFALSTPAMEGVTARLSIFDLSGRRVAVVRGPACSRLLWRGRSDSGQQLPGGVYFYLLEIGSRRQRGRLVLVP